MIRNFIIIPLLVFIWFFVIVYFQGPDETTKSDVLDMKTGKFVKAEMNNRPPAQAVESSQAR